MQDDEDFKKISLFAELNSDELSLVKKCLARHSFPKGTHIIRESQVAHSLYIITKGSVKVYRSNDKGKEVVIGILSAGEHFGEISLVDQKPRSAHIVAQTNCKVLTIQREDFVKLYKEVPTLAFNLLNRLCERLRLADELIQSLALSDVYNRITELLYSLAQKNPKTGKYILSEPLTHREIASRIGASREMVSRIMGDLTTGEYISISGKRITINTEFPSSW